VTAERWQRVKDVFQSAAEQRPEDRDAFLDAATSGDGELRREVDKMLRCATGTGPLDRPAWDGLPFDRELAAGSHLGPYEILRQAGAGGMGRVYQARDTRLGRTVAIKVLGAEFSYRFQTEARAISTLNHPHVCGLYDIGEQAGAAYLVMEYVEGESLAARLERGPLPLQEVLRYGEEIADALAAAHAQAIVHRDLKPANIMITRSGVKVLDFGVAQMPGGEDPSTGAVVGTLAYMSPSQWNGNPADARSDIFALGLVLYEMATGERPSRSSPAPLTNVPAGLAGLVARCLRNDAASRVQSMEEVRLALEQLRREPPAPPRRWRNPAWAAAMALVAISGGALTWNVTRPRPLPSPPLVLLKASAPAPTKSAAPPSVAATPAPALPRPAIQPVSYSPPSFPSVLRSYPGLERDPAFSPDGRSIAYSWHPGSGANYSICVRSLSPDAPPRSLTNGGTEDWGPAWSPDGRTIAFRRRGNQPGIYQVPVAGSPATLLASIAPQHQETLPQMSWSPDGRWIAAPDRDATRGTQIYLFPVRNGDKRQLTFNSTGTDHAPAFSPDGKLLAYASCQSGVSACDVYVLSLRPGGPAETHRITHQDVYIRGIAWLPDGASLVYAAGERQSSKTFLWRVSLRPPGPPQRLDLAGSSVRHPAISPAGGLLAYTNLASNRWDLMLIRNFR
jgi:serine/threonine protein kinase